MKHPIKKLSRRRFIQGAGKASLALPLLDYFAWVERAQAQAPAPKNFGIFYMENNSLMASNWLQEPASGNTLNIPATGHYTLQPLRGKESLLTCLVMSTPYLGGHPNGNDLSCSFYTEYGINGAGNSRPRLPCVTHQMAPFIEQGAPYRLNFAGSTTGLETNIFTGSPMNTVAVPYETNIETMLSKYFQEVGAPNPADTAKETRAKSLIDSVLASINSLKKDIGRDDKQKLDTYLETVRSLEVQVAQKKACAKPNVMNQPSWTDRERLEAEIKIIAAAMACGVAQVFNLTPGGGTKRHSYLADRVNFGNSTVDNAVKSTLALPMHDYTHGTFSHEGHSSETLNIWGKALLVVGQYYVEMFGKLIDEVQSYEGLMDRTVLVGMSELGAGGHNIGNANTPGDHANHPIILVDGTGHFKRNYFARVNDSNPNLPCGTGSQSEKCVAVGSQGQHLALTSHLFTTIGREVMGASTFSAGEWTTAKTLPQLLV